MELTEEQRHAVSARTGPVLVSAGAGTGKTSVLVERFVAAVLEDGVEVDAILAITFTEKAATQLAERVRSRFVALGARDRARQVEAAWISTIHGFCARVLRIHALAAGIDPEFRVLDAVEAERLGIDAFDRALGGFLGAGEDSERLHLLAAYTPDRLADMVRTAYGHLRSRGHAEPELPEPVRPRAAGEREALGDAVAAALAEIGAAEGQAAGRARDKLERCAALIRTLGDERVADPVELEGLAFQGSANALRGNACERFRSAHAAYLDHCARHREYSNHVLLRDLIARYGRHYTELKRERSGLDFDDLELVARDLLRDEREIRTAYAERYAHVMVDEFQDTNPLQNEILELLERDNLFRVGDERQSIYGFRHADVGLFARHRERATAQGREQPIRENFRSRGELLDAIDLTFGRVWGESFEPLRAGPAARTRDPSLTPCVELLVTDREKRRWDARFAAELEEGGEPFGASMRGVTPWRAAEARLLARRIDELTGPGGYSYGEVVLLLRATTHLGIYGRALEERGIPTYVLGGRGYWSQQQVGDLRAYLAALANPLDELALCSVLASPLAGVSLDALVIAAGAARRAGWDLWRTLEATGSGPATAAGAAPRLPGGHEEVGAGLPPAGGDEEGPAGLPPSIASLPAKLPAADAERVRAFTGRFRHERASAPRVSLETLIDRAVTGSGYDRTILAMPAGERRMANVRKLMRMAREYEADEGRDLRGFIDFVAERDLIQEREGQAPLEAEDLDAVKLMTIHRAKGLEFPVVCVADLGKGGREDDAALRITDDGRVGMRLASIGGGAIDSAALGRIREQQKLDDEEEEKRIFYVAATRAEEHLILSGATDLEKLSPEAPLEEPMRWLWRALAPALPELGARGESSELYEGREVPVRCEVLRPAAADELLPAPERVPRAPELEPPGLDALQAPALAAVPVPRAMPVSRLSYSSLARYERCGYRFYLERALGLPPAHEPAPPAAEREEAAGAGAAEPAGEPAALVGERVGVTGTTGEAVVGVSPLVRGAIVHELLERLDFERPEAPAAAEVAALLESHGEPVRDDEVTCLIGMVEAFASSQLCERLARARRTRTELPFAFTLDTGGRSLLINGVVDVHAVEPDGVLVVDYKSDRLGGREPEELVEAAYATQRLVYALAALRSGAPRVEVTYVLLERPGEPVSASYGAADVPQLEGRLLELVDGVVAGRFEPTQAPHRRLCGDCPARPALCSWGPARTLAEEPEPDAAPAAEAPRPPAEAPRPPAEAPRPSR